MIIRVSDIEDEGLTVQDPAQVGVVYADLDWRLEGLTLSVTRDGADVDVAGEIRATVPQACSRCLETFLAPVRARVDVRLVPKGLARDDAELGRDDLDVDFYENDEIDLGRLIQNETTLALPMKALCREDCRGLCPGCGGNRNLTPCQCAAGPPDPRLAGLRDIAARLQH
jgi:uncharacterized protein